MECVKLQVGVVGLRSLGGHLSTMSRHPEYRRETSELYVYIWSPMCAQNDGKKTLPPSCQSQGVSPD